MEALEDFKSCLLDNYSTLGVSAIALLLISLESFMEEEFTCPTNPDLSIGYSVIFFLTPALVLGIIGYKLSGHIRCRVTCRCVLKTFYGPLLWIAILLTDGRYVACFVTSEETEADIRQISQIVGIILISLLLILSFVVEELCCCRRISALYYREKYEEKMLKELEEGLRAKAMKKETEIAEDFVEMVSDESFTPQKANWLETLENLVCKEKIKIRDRFKESTIISEEEHRQAEAGRATSDEQAGGSDESRSSI